MDNKNLTGSPDSKLINTEEEVPYCMSHKQGWEAVNGSYSIYTEEKK